MDELNSYYENHYNKIVYTGAVGLVAKMIHWTLEHEPFSSLNRGGGTPML